MLLIVGNMYSNSYVSEMLQLVVVRFFQGTSGSMFQQNNPGPHVAENIRDFLSAEHI